MQHAESAASVAPQLAVLACWSGLAWRLAALRTRDEIGTRSGRDRDEPPRAQRADGRLRYSGERRHDLLWHYLLWHYLLWHYLLWHYLLWHYLLLSHYLLRHYLLWRPADVAD